MRTRCPVCSTVFRVTSEQLRRKVGKVRCGQCHSVFNAFDGFVPDVDEVPAVATLPPEPSPVPVEDVIASADTPPVIDEYRPSLADDVLIVVDLPGNALDGGALEPIGGSLGEAAEQSEVLADIGVSGEAAEALPHTLGADAHEAEVSETAIAADVSALPLSDQADVSEAAGEAVSVDGATDTASAEASDMAVDKLASDATGDASEGGIPVSDLDALPDDPTLAGRQAGLIAARELAETPGFNRWAAGTLASDGQGGFAGDVARRPVWPFVLVALLLALVLAGQLIYHFRTAIVLRMPSLAGAYQALSIDVPYPRDVALVSIETSDLQSDNARSLFMLQATLKNRADFPQAWPALELTLTDTNDAVVARRVMFAADYLPPGTTSDAFPANGETPVKLWIEARDIGAAGYRLYIFYP